MGFEGESRKLTETISDLNTTLDGMVITQRRNLQHLASLIGILCKYLDRLV